LTRSRPSRLGQKPTARAGILRILSDATRLVEAADRGDQQAATDLLPMVYDELRKLTGALIVHEA
jgi:hypothetical protein